MVFNKELLDVIDVNDSIEITLITFLLVLHAIEELNAKIGIDSFSIKTGYIEEII